MGIWYRLWLPPFAALTATATNYAALGEINMRTKRNSFLAAAIVIFLLTFASISAAPDQADISITNTAQPNPATVSTPTMPRNITYGMNVINNGPNRATAVQVSFTLPAPVTLVSARFNFIGGPSNDCASK